LIFPKREREREREIVDVDGLQGPEGRRGRIL
jgi:hypothetical protein